LNLNCLTYIEQYPLIQILDDLHSDQKIAYRYNYIQDVEYKFEFVVIFLEHLNDYLWQYDKVDRHVLSEDNHKYDHESFLFVMHLNKQSSFFFKQIEFSI
jgi:hypothetical protein